MINECIPRACVVTAHHSPVWPDTVRCPFLLGHHALCGVQTWAIFISFLREVDTAYL